MRLVKLLTFIAVVPFLVSCSKEMNRDAALKRINEYKLDEAKTKYGDTLNIHVKTEVKKATGVFSETGELHEKVSKYTTSEKDDTATISSYFVTASKISGYNANSYKYLKISFKANGSKGLIINLNQSDEENKAGIISKMKQSIYDQINDDGILMEETVNFYYSWSGEKEGEFEYSSTVKVITNN